MTIVQTPLQLINQRRRQLHVHSLIYYHFNTSIITDAVFDQYAKELVVLYIQYPELVDEGYLHSVFKGWTGDTGMHLPLKEDAWQTAEWLINYHQANPSLPKEVGSEPCMDFSERTGVKRPPVTTKQWNFYMSNPTGKEWEGDVGYKTDS